MVSTKKIIKVVAPLLVGVLLLWLLYRKMDFQSFKRTLTYETDWGIMIVAALFGTLGNYFRGLRWSLLLETIKRPKKLVGNSCLTVQGNYAVNMLLPRLGELWRCSTMKLYTGISFSQLLGTVVVDRGMDILVAIGMTIVAGLINFGFFQNFFVQNPEFISKLESLAINPLFWLSLIGLILLLGVGVYWFIIRKAGSGSGDGIGDRINGAVCKVWEGLKTVWTLRRKWIFFLYTSLIWVSYFLQFYLTFYAFDFMMGLGWQEALLAFVLITFAVAAPVQGGLGPWHFMVIFSLVFFGIKQSDAASFALIVHSLQTLWTTLVGIVSIAFLPAYNRS